MEKFPYASAVDSLMYVMISTRLGIAYAVGVLAGLWQNLEWIIGWLLNGSLDIELCFSGKSVVLEGYCDADLGCNFDTHRSTSGYLYCLGGTAVRWKSKLQSQVALSTTEAEYDVAAEAKREDLVGELVERVGLHSKKSSTLQ